jgi:hypothetical protein
VDYESATVIGNFNDILEFKALTHGLRLLAGNWNISTTRDYKNNGRNEAGQRQQARSTFTARLDMRHSEILTSSSNSSQHTQKPADPA